MFKAPKPLWERFWEKVRKTDSCHLFTSLRPDGYGQISVNGRQKKAHVVLWQAENGPLPPGHELHHECRNKPCVRLGKGHVVLLTKAAHRALYHKDVCKRGHPRRPDNLYIMKNGYGHCRQCTLDDGRLAAERKRTNRLVAKSA